MEMDRKMPEEVLDENELGFKNRLLTALLAPLFFNLPIAIVVILMNGRGQRLHKMALFSGGAGWMVLLFLLPAIAGFCMGSRRFAHLMGHFFYTNMEGEKDIRMTLMLWTGLAATIYFVWRAIS